MTSLLRRSVLASALALIAVGVTACGTTNVAAPADSTSAAPVSDSCAADATTTSTAPVSLTDGLGRTVALDKPASRVAVLEWQQTEDLLTLCVTPVAASDTEGYATYVSAETLPASVADVGERNEPDFDALFATDPDLVIVETFDPDNELIQKLEARGVAVLATKGADTADPIGNMKDVFRMIAEATGRTERADQVLDEFDAHLAEGRQQVAALSLPTKSFLFFDGWVEGGNAVVRPYGEGALFTALGEQLGLVGAWTAEVDSAYGDGGVDPAYGLGQTDIEGLIAVGDATLFYSSDEAADGYVAELQKSPIWASLPAVQQGRAYAFPAGVWGAGGPRSNERAVDAFVEALQKG
jgi:ferric hydroxamate transport system substrate-binding protein